MVEESHYDLLRDAIFDNDRARVAELLDLDGINVDHFDAGGQTLLHLASFWGRMDIVKLLLSVGASMKTKNAAGCTALDLAVHWGHSAVAEVIRLRGGSSVWEDKLGLIQVALEDANLKLADIQERYAEKCLQLEAKTSEIHVIEKQLEEERGAHVLTTHRLQDAQHSLDELDSQVMQHTQTIHRLNDELQRALVDKGIAESAREQSERKTTDLLANRDELLANMEESVAKQEDSAYNWQRAEVAAAVADSQRNFALIDRDRCQKRHGAALGELAITTARLVAAEQEMMEIKTELAEYIYEFTKIKRSQKRAAKALQSLPQSKTGSKHGLRAVTAPVPQSHSPHLPINYEKTKAAASTDELVAGNGSEIAVAHGIAYPKKQKKQFSLAARDFGDKLRAQEQKKEQLRAQELQRVENQFLANGLHVRVAEADRFQEEFVSTVRAFSTSRANRWKELKDERDQQLRFTSNAQSRIVCTAPGGSRASSEFHIPERDSRKIRSPTRNAEGEEWRRAAACTSRRRLQAGLFAVDNTEPNDDQSVLEQGAASFQERLPSI